MNDEHPIADPVKVLANRREAIDFFKASSLSRVPICAQCNIPMQPELRPASDPRRRVHRCSRCRLIDISTP